MDEPHVERGVLKTVEAAGDVRIDRALVGMVSGRDVSITNAGAGPVAAQGDVQITMGGCGPVLARGGVSITNGGARSRHCKNSIRVTSFSVLGSTPRKPIRPVPGRCVRKIFVVTAR